MVFQYTGQILTENMNRKINQKLTYRVYLHLLYMNIEDCINIARWLSLNKT